MGGWDVIYLQSSISFSHFVKRGSKLDGLLLIGQKDLDCGPASVLAAAHFLGLNPLIF